MPKALVINPADTRTLFPPVDGSPPRVCVDQGHFSSLEPRCPVRMSTYMEGAQSQLNEESYKFRKSFNLIVRDESEDDLVNTQ